LPSCQIVGVPDAIPDAVRSVVHRPSLAAADLARRVGVAVDVPAIPTAAVSTAAIDIVTMTAW
jgi:hypothetical protein